MTRMKYKSMYLDVINELSTLRRRIRDNGILLDNIGKPWLPCLSFDKTKWEIREDNGYFYLIKRSENKNDDRA